MVAPSNVAADQLAIQAVRAADLAVATGVTARRLQVLRYQKGSAVAALEVAALGIGMHQRVSPRFKPPPFCADIEVLKNNLALQLPENVLLSFSLFFSHSRLIFTWRTESKDGSGQYDKFYSGLICCSHDSIPFATAYDITGAVVK